MRLHEPAELFKLAAKKDHRKSRKRSVIAEQACIDLGGAYMDINFSEFLQLINICIGSLQDKVSVACLCV